ncbi:MAG: D-aminoacylase [Kiritimatiellae bacterium]|nr:D-aminoacylase [Kiritimatiellia bacterium]
MFDLKIVNGDVLDGTGAGARRTDVGIRNGRIADCGNLSAAEAASSIDATGRTVCPGFIDAHSHSDSYLLLEPSAPSKVFQGITTEVLGNCGTSAAPVTGKYDKPSEWREKKYPGAWQTVAEYRALLERVGPGPNAVLLVGHNNLRGAAVGYEARAAGADELRAMVRLLEQALDEGARGLSTGLIYTPGLFAPVSEITTLAGVVARRGGVYTSHMRSESDRLLEAIDETLAIGRDSGVAVRISHLKTARRENWALLDPALTRIRGAIRDGMDLAADRYPYIASSTSLSSLFPQWACEGGREACLARLGDPAQKARLREALLASHPAEYWETVAISSTSHPDNKRFQGKRLMEAADALGQEPVDAFLHVVQADALTTGGIFFGMSEENMWRILAEPYVMIGTDASLRAPTGPLSLDHPHPRSYGSFPRFIRAALDGRTVSLPEAVRKCTSLPADRFGLSARGRLVPGYAADIVVFDPAALRDAATYESPHRLAEGITHVVINGVVTIAEGRLTGERGGRVL